MISADDGPVNGTTARSSTFDTISGPAFVCALLLTPLSLNFCVNGFMDEVADGNNGSRDGECGSTMECGNGHCGCNSLLGYKRKLR